MSGMVGDAELAAQDVGDALARLGDADAAADAYLSGIDQAEKFGHHGMADDFRDAIESL